MTTSERAQCVALHCEKNNQTTGGASKRPMRYVRCGFSPEMVAQVKQPVRRGVEGWCRCLGKCCRGRDTEHCCLVLLIRTAFHDIGVESLAVLEVMDMVLHYSMTMVFVGYDGMCEHHDKSQQAEAERNCLISTHPRKYSDYSGFFA